MRLCFDVDGVICIGGHPYSECTPIPKAVDTIRKLKEQGHVIILHTARYMKICNGDVKKATRKGKKELEEWLEKHNVPYDELYLGKPSANYYFDDRGFRIDSTNPNSVTLWDQILEHLKPA